MNKDDMLTEYFEDAMRTVSEEKEEGEVLLLDVPDQMVERTPEPLVVSFSEEDFQENSLEEGSLEEDGDLSLPFDKEDEPFEDISFEEDMGEFDEVNEFTEEGEFDELPVMDEEVDTEEVDTEEISFVEELDSIEDDIDENIEVLEDATEEIPQREGGRYLPGSNEPIYDDEEEEEEEEEVETNWSDDRDPGKFIDYLRENFANVPQHNGNSISGCERALKHFNKLHKEISEAVRKDENSALDPVLDEVEDFRVKILKGMVALKHRVGELKKKFKQEGSQRIASESLKNLVKESIVDGEITKEAKSGKLQVVITPFERGITGILINSVVSAGHPFEDVYEYLKKKFDLTPREELAILQIVMDMGFPIFKDRGSIGENGDGEGDKHGVDFIKNYFA